VWYIIKLNGVIRLQGARDGGEGGPAGQVTPAVMAASPGLADLIKGGDVSKVGVGIKLFVGFYRAVDA
jgi:hypothetical protein